jgi:hypothetical protein
VDGGACIVLSPGSMSDWMGMHSCRRWVVFL